MPRRLLLSLALLVPVALALVALLGGFSRSERYPIEQEVTGGGLAVRYSRVDAQALGLPELRGAKCLGAYRYQSYDRRGELICALSRATLVVPGAPAQVAAQLRRERRAALSQEGKATLAWWGSPKDVTIATLTASAPGHTRLVAERATRGRETPRLTR